VTPPSTPDYVELLRHLASHRIEFIIVGGVCAVLHGAPVATFDLDIVHRRTPENVDRLIEALAAIDARARGRAGARVTPGASHLLGDGHQLLDTIHGPLDLLGSVGNGSSYEDLLESCSELSLAHGITVRVLSLEGLIKLKEETNREKDRAVLPVLRRTLQERDRR